MMTAWQLPHTDLEEQSITDLQAAMESGQRTSRQLVEAYIERIQALNINGPMLRAVIEVNPDALAIAEALDRERAERGPRGPLHGIPILLKDTIDTADKMETTAGSLALVGARHADDAWVVKRLRMAGAVLLGKANLSEWANFRSTHSSSGWSARGGQARNPYALDRTPCGSSSGSASAVAANLCAASVGTETDGSILCPASTNGVVGIKPTVGLTSRAGVIPIAHSQDTVGPFGRTVADAAILLGALAGEDASDPATHGVTNTIPADYRSYLNADALRGARIGIPREVYTGFSEKTDAVFTTVIETLKSLGAVLVDPADMSTAKQMQTTRAELTVLLYEFKADLNAYLSKPGPEALVHSLEELIAFNQEHAADEMPYFGQELFEQAQAKGPLTEQEYLDARAECLRLAHDEGIDAVMREHHLDALCMPTGAPAWKIDAIDGDHDMGGCSQPAALAGYPAISVPAGYTFGLPIGVTFMGLQYTEAKLISYAYAFEQATKVRFAPTYPAETP
ncbi:MAG TPA: amidase [Ktedonobacterales bacterium]|nr:amidase [Ktedonobacterales bacterium]